MCFTTSSLTLPRKSEWTSTAIVSVDESKSFGVAVTIAVGVALVPLLGMALQGLLPVSSGVIVDPGAILLALSYGMLVALVFAAPPLLRARHFPAMALMRSRVAPLARTGVRVVPASAA